MRTAFVILVVATLALAGAVVQLHNDTKKMQAELRHAHDLIALRNAEVADVQRKLSECASRLHVSVLSVDELRKRGNVATTVEGWLELVCVRAPDRSFDPSVPITLATKIQLSTTNGVTYTFVSRRLEPLNITAEDSEHFRFILAYEPLNASEVEGRPIEDFAAIATLTTHYNDVLHAIGLQVAPDGIRTFTMNINGLEAARVQGFRTEINPPGDVVWNVANSFTAIVSNYVHALQQRIANRAANETPEQSERTNSR